MKKKNAEEEEKFSIGALLLQGVATSIDAFAVGISMRMTEISSYLHPSIGFDILIIGTTTFILSAASVGIGKKLGNKLADKAQIIGGVALLAIGIKCLLEAIL